MTTVFDEALAVFEGVSPLPGGEAPRVTARLGELFDPPKVKFWEPFPKQAMAADLTTRCFELLFGGSAGPGKACSSGVTHVIMRWLTRGRISGLSAGPFPN